MALTVEDVEKLQKLFPEHKIELRDGAITIVSPSDIVSGMIGARFSRFLGNWVDPRKLGFVFDSSSGFQPPNGDLTAPDVSYVSRARLSRLPRSYGPLVPDLVVEIKSSTDRLKSLEDKIESYLQLGAKVGVLVDPDGQTATVYRCGVQPVGFFDNDILELPELLPGWQLQLAELWPIDLGED
ncbi:MAG: Uma2 family endonuclease [Aphanocapsa lilacina HA4352-LM1]|jgi:Uma2 family endonuclease|nr:Uma2 family endonuclease [Aphanocapsa lilacina HA4352-LM1]